ncbi:MAG: hypothetical protein NXI19_10530 [Alphaproteobacteria bacterium]|nr:hypothetical protein [Alphaproteobacteria bacterium]
MYRDNSLIPKEAIRLAALGLLAEQPRTYAALASEVRNVTSRLVGPSIELLGPPIELLRIEGLVATQGKREDSILSLTDAGKAELEKYLTAAVRPGVSDLNRLVLALKLRFVDQMSTEDRAEQLAAIQSMYEGEKARLADLLSHPEWGGGLLDDWLSLEIEQVERRIAWCQKIADEA